MNDRSQFEDLLQRLQDAMAREPRDTEAIGRLLGNQQAADIALAIEELDVDGARQAFATLPVECGASVLSMLAPELTRSIVEQLEPAQLQHFVDRLPNREAAALLVEQSKRAVQKSAQAGRIDARVAADAAQRRHYPAGSAGRLMTTHFVRLHPTMSVAEALEVVRRTNPDEDLPDDLFVVEPEASGPRERLVGVISIRDALMARSEQTIGELMEQQVVCVTATTTSVMAARLLSKHKFLALPITDADGFLLGVISSEDLMQVTLAELYGRYAKTVGTDAAAMEQMSPAQAAKTRVPWLLGTMVIELGAAVLITHFNAVLVKVILLASFMPVISAVSGNVGLQAAAITVRGLDAGAMSIRAAGKALFKESATTLLMAAVCGVVLGLIGGFWSGHVMFGVVIGLALTCSMMTAAFMGTLFPILSKRLGFDPATTAGPFETAFQDVIGFGVFLGLATLFASRM
jgi:magnesium transporter